ncbi:hypothetical protein ACVWYG_003889 [Pedobacter sp. UYEF25]
MKNWKRVKEKYIEDHLSKTLANTKRRLAALKAIELLIEIKKPELLKDDNLFESMDKTSFMKMYETIKKADLSSAEKSVINGLYKFAN